MKIDRQRIGLWAAGLLAAVGVGIGGLMLSKWARSATTTAEDFITQARIAFGEKDDDTGAAYLSAALVQAPTYRSGLDLFRELTHDRFKSALSEKDWELAHLQLAGYDTTVRAALKAASDRGTVEDLLARQHEITAWESELYQARDRDAVSETLTARAQIGKADAHHLRAIEVRLKQISQETLGTKASEDVAAAAAQVLAQRHRAESQRLRQDYSRLSENASAGNTSVARLRELRVEAQHLQGQVIEAGLDGAETTKLQADCEGLLTQLDQRLQVLSIRQMQQIADADAVKALDTVEGIFQEVGKNRNEWTYHRCGEKLADAETQLGRIDRLCSLEVQKKALDYQQKVRHDALACRTSQQMQYNLWAIDVLRDAMADYQKKKGYFKDDKEGLKSILAESLGQIDAQHLHPVTHALFTEMFQKILGDLSNDMKVEATKAIEEMKKKPISDF